jgi:hypothetical protein
MVAFADQPRRGRRTPASVLNQQDEVLAEMAFKKLVSIIGDAVRDAGDEGMPSGVLYAVLDERINLPLDLYQKVIQAFINEGVMKSDFHVLRWIGQ